MLKFNDLMAAHGAATLMVLEHNSNGTVWLCSDGNACNNGDSYCVLANDTEDSSLVDGLTLRELYDQTDLLEVQVDGVTVY